MAERDDLDEVHTESSGEEEEVSEQASQQPQRDTVPKDTLPVSKTNLAPPLPPPPPVNAATSLNQVTT